MAVGGCILQTLGFLIEGTFLVNGIIWGIEMHPMFNYPLHQTNLRAFWGNWCVCRRSIWVLLLTPRVSQEPCYQGRPASRRLRCRQGPEEDQGRDQEVGRRKGQRQGQRKGQQVPPQGSALGNRGRDRSRRRAQIQRYTVRQVLGSGTKSRGSEEEGRRCQQTQGEGLRGRQEEGWFGWVLEEGPGRDVHFPCFRPVPRGPSCSFAPSPSLALKV